MANSEQYSVQRIIAEGASKAPIRYSGLDILRWSIVNFAKGNIGEPLDQLTEVDIKQLNGFFEARNHRAPHSIADAIEFGLKAYNYTDTNSLNVPATTNLNEDRELGEHLPDNNIAVEDQAITSVMIGCAVEALRTLPPNQQEVITKYYFEDFTQKELGDACGLTARRIGQIQAKAINNLGELLSMPDQAKSA